MYKIIFMYDLSLFQITLLIASRVKIDMYIDNNRSIRLSNAHPCQKDDRQMWQVLWRTKGEREDDGDRAAPLLRIIF